MNHSKELIEQTRELSILFAEDHDELRENTTDILKYFFKRVDSVSNGVEAFEYYAENLNKNNKYDLVLTDIQMPKMNGVVLTQKIYELYPKQCVVVLSAHDTTEYLLPLINLGIEQFIKKPIDYQELLKVLLVIAKKINFKEETQISHQNIYFDKTTYFNKETKSLIENKNSLYLTKYEIIFLMLLSTKVGKIHSNEDIVNYFNDEDESIDSQNIRKLVSKLRKKLPEDTLESIYGVGYKLNSIT